MGWILTGRVKGHPFETKCCTFGLVGVARGRRGRGPTLCSHQGGICRHLSANNSIIQNCTAAVNSLATYFSFSELCYYRFLFKRSKLCPKVMTGNRFSLRSFHFDKRRDDVAATTHLPSEVTGAEAAGDAQRTSQWWLGGGPLLWHVGEVGAGGRNGPPGHTQSPTSLRTRGNRGARCHLLPAKGGKKQ